jgi:hypothetical protein
MAWLRDEPDLPRPGPEAVLYAVLDAVIDGYAPVVAASGNRTTGHVRKGVLGSV